MTDDEIEKLKQDGAIQSLRRRIDSEIFKITDRMFQGNIGTLAFKSLHVKLEEVRYSCDLIDRLLQEVRKLDGVST